MARIRSVSPAPRPQMPWTVKPETKTARWNRSEFGYGGYYIYALYEGGGQLLYVGVTGNPVERWRRHAQRKPWWSQVTHIDFDKAWRQSDALARERELIRDLAPLHNIRSAAPR